MSDRKPPRHAVVLGRRRKGRPIASVVDSVARELRAAGWRVDDAVVTRKKSLRRRTAKAAKHGADIVVAVGGDGAVNQIASKLVETGTKLAIVPTGTGNLLAGNLGIPKRQKDAVRTILEGASRRIDVSAVEIDGKRRVSAVALGIGFDAEVMDATTRGQKLRWGKLAYLANSLLQSGGLTARCHAVSIDGVTIELDAAQVFVANVGRMLPFVTPEPEIVPDDGLLDVIAITASGPIPALLAGWEALHQGTLGQSRGGHLYRARGREVRIETDSPRLVEIDGSVAGRTPVGVSVVPGGLDVIVPRHD